MRRRLQFFWAAVAIVAASGTAVAQRPRSVAPADPPGPVHNMLDDQNQDQPIQIDAATLEVRDKNKMATFTGNVQVVQGDTTMKCQTLVVYYGQEIGIGGDTRVATAAKTGPGAPRNAQNIRRIEARGGVTVVTKDQNASGDLGIYDLKAKTITLTGNVVVGQGQNVIHGERVVVDMVTGNARVESSAGAVQNRVRALIIPNKDQNGGSSNFMTIGPGR